MKVEKICNLDLVAAEVSDSLVEAAGKMSRNYVGALPVLDQGKLVGVISESDIVCAVAENVSLEVTPVEEYMTGGAVTVSAGDDVALAARRMLVHRIHHLPVVDGESTIGMISSGDLLAAGARPGDV